MTSSLRRQHASSHPDLCPTCRAPISAAQRERIDAAQRCTCPVGFGAVADPNCPRHGATARHTITGPAEALGDDTTEAAA